MTVLKAETIQVSIDAPFDQVVADLADPRSHPEWATEFFEGPLVQGPDGAYEGASRFFGGPIRYKVDSLPQRGVFDLYIAPKGAPFGGPLPMRVTANGGGVDVTWTLHQFPDMPDAAFAAGQESFRREAAALKRRLESRSQRGQ